MPRHEPLGRPTPNEVIGAAKVTFRRGADGKLAPSVPPKRTTETTESKPEPRDAPDPRPSSVRQVPPFGAGV